MAIAFGYLISETTAPLKNKNTFMGVEAHQKTPIEIAAIAFIGAGVACHTLLIVDSFQETNKADASYLVNGKAALKSKVELLQMAYAFDVNILEASSFMGTPAYNAIYCDVGKQISDKNLETQLAKTLPEGKHDLTFAFHEVAVCRYMELEHGMEAKIGQKREKLYDGAIGKITGLDFAYLFPFYAFGTGEEIKTPYNPESGAKEGGKRIMLNDNPERVSEIIGRGPLNAQISLTRLGFAAATLKGSPIALSEKYPQPENCLNSVEAIFEQCELMNTNRRFAKYRYYGKNE